MNTLSSKPEERAMTATKAATTSTRSVKQPQPLSQPMVADYIVGRLAREGITDCFGVPGDFTFKLCDAVARSEAIRWSGCPNELDAAYAADGYARVRGCSMLLTTYAVGELSALNGVMGARAERSCVFHVVGMPTMRRQRARQVVHHTLGDGDFQNFANISAQAACVSAGIPPHHLRPPRGGAVPPRRGGGPPGPHP